MPLPTLPIRDGLIAHLDPSSLGYSDGQKVTEAPAVGGYYNWYAQNGGPILRRRKDGTAYLQQTNAGGPGLRWAQPAFSNLREAAPSSLGPTLTGETEVYRGALWYKATFNSNGTVRQYVPLASLTNGATYTGQFLAANPNSVAITASIDWCDIGGDSVTLQPGEVRRLYVTASRGTYDATYRFLDINVGTEGPLLFREVQVEAGSIANAYIPPGSYGPSTDGTIFVVARMRGTANNRIVSGLSNNALFGWHGNTEDDFYGDGWVRDSATAATPTLKNYAFRRSGSTSSIWSSGVLLTANGNAASLANGLSTNGYLGQSEFSDSEVYEVIVYSRALSDGEIEQVSRYLSEKFFSQSKFTNESDGPVVGSILGPVFSGGSLPGRLHVRQANDSLDPDYVDEVLASDPIDYRRFTESSGPILDWSRRNHSPVSPTGTFRRDIAGPSGTGTGAYLNGNVTINLGNHPDFQNIGDQTIEMWLRPDNLAAGRQNPWDKAYAGEGTITQEPDGSLNYYYGIDGTNGTTYQGFNSGVVLTQGKWHHLVLVRDLLNMRLKWYVNGAKVADGAASYAAAKAGTNNRVLGVGYTGVAYVGGMDEVAEYARALSDDEILRHYRKGKPGDPPPNMALSFADWELRDGAYIEDATGDLILPNNGAYALSPMFEVGTAASWWWSADYLTFSGGSTSFPGAGGIYQQSDHYDANGVATNNTAGYSANGDAPTWAHGSWTRKTWSNVAGNLVRYVRMQVNSHVSYSPNTPIRVRNPQFTTYSSVGGVYTSPTRQTLPPPGRAAKVLAIAEVSTSLRSAISNLGYTDITVNTSASTLAHLEGYDLIVDSGAWGGVQKPALLAQAYDAGYSIISDGNDSTSASVPFITATVGQSGYGLNPIAGSTHYVGQGWTGGYTDADTGNIITGLRSTAVAIASWPRSDAGGTGFTGILEENPNGSGGRWVHFNNYVSWTYPQMVQRALDWLTSSRPASGEDVTTRITVQTRTAADSAPADTTTATQYAVRSRTASDSAPADTTTASRYSYRVRTSSDAVRGTDEHEGLAYRWFDTTGMTLNPTTKAGFDALFAGSPAGQGLHLSNIDWTYEAIRPSYITAADNYAWEVSGYLFAPYSGSYTFYTGSDDGNELVINGTIVTAVYAGRGYTEAADSGTITLTQGYHSFRYRMQEGGGGSGAQVRWLKPGDSSHSVIPPEFFTPNYLPQGDSETAVYGTAGYFSASVTKVTSGDIASGTGALEIGYNPANSTYPQGLIWWATHPGMVAGAGTPIIVRAKVKGIPGKTYGISGRPNDAITNTYTTESLGHRSFVATGSYQTVETLAWTWGNGDFIPGVQIVTSDGSSAFPFRVDDVEFIGLRGGVRSVVYRRRTRDLDLMREQSTLEWSPGGTIIRTNLPDPDGHYRSFSVDFTGGQVYAIPHGGTYSTADGFVNGEEYETTLTVEATPKGIVDEWSLAGTYAGIYSTLTNVGTLTNRTGPGGAANTALEFTGGVGGPHLQGTKTLPNGEPSVPTSGSYTLDAWVFPDSHGNQGIVGYGNYGTNNQVNALRLYSGGIHNYWWGNDLSVSTGAANLAGSWHHICATYDHATTTHIIYLDGVEMGRRTATWSGAPATNFAIGRTWPGDEAWDGGLAHVGVFNRALTPTEVQARYTTPGYAEPFTFQWSMEGSATTLDGQAAYQPVQIDKDWTTLKRRFTYNGGNFYPLLYSLSGVAAGRVLKAFRPTFTRITTDSPNRIDYLGRSATESTGVTDSVASYAILKRTGSDAINEIETMRNGTAATGTLANFSMFDSVTDGGFRAIGYRNLESDDYIEVDPNQPYTQSAQWRGDPANGQYNYVGLATYDAEKQHIGHEMIVRAATTTLAADLKPGDTQVQLTDSTGWKSAGSAQHERWIQMFPYIDPKGRRYEIGSGYSRNVVYDAWAAGGIVGNSIVLRNPWSLTNPEHPQGWWPAGTPVANTVGGGTYVYSLAAPTTVTSSYVTATATIAAQVVGNASAGFRPATKFVRFLVLNNYADSGGVGAATIYRNISLRAPAPLDMATAYTFRARTTGDDAPATDDGFRNPITFARAGADDITGVTDAVVRDAGVFSRAIGDTVTPTDSADRIATMPRPVFDDIWQTISDAATQNASRSRAGDDDLTGLTDSPASPTLHPRTATSDASGTTDAAARGTATMPRSGSSEVATMFTDAARFVTAPRSVSETIAEPTDTVARSGVFGRTVTEDPTYTDEAATRLTVQPRTTGDDAPADDEAVQNAYRSRTTDEDITGATDDTTVPRYFDGERQISDSAPASDAVTHLTTLYRTTADTVAEPTEVGTRAGVPFYRAPGDDAPAYDDGYRNPITFARSAEETLTTTDEAVRDQGIFSRTPEDDASLTDAATRYVEFPRTSDDFAPATDTAEGDALAYRTGEDDAPAYDEVEHLTTLIRSPEDDAPAVIEDTSYVIAPRYGTDITLINLDVATQNIYAPRSQVEDATGTDDSVSSYSSTYRTATSSIDPPTDAITHATLLIRTAEDAAPAEDWSDRLITFARSTEDSSVTDDDAIRVAYPYRWTFDAEITSDEASQNADRVRTSDDDASLTDEANGVGYHTRWATDSVEEPTDEADRYTFQPRDGADQANADDEAERNGEFARDAVDTAPAGIYVERSQILVREVTDEVPEPLISTASYADKNVSLTEDISGLTDTAVRSGQFWRDLTDDAPAEQETSRIPIRVRSTSDSIPEPTDSVVRSAGLFYRVPGDGAPATDDGYRNPVTFARGATDQIFDTFSDLAIRNGVFNREGTEEVQEPTEAPSSYVLHIRNPIDYAEADDFVSRYTQVSRDLDDPASLLDSATRMVMFPRAGAETLATPGDSGGAFAFQYRTPADYAPAYDTLNSYAYQERIAEDLLPATNVTSSEARLFRRIADDLIHPIDTPVRSVRVWRDGLSLAPMTDEADGFSLHLRALAEWAGEATDSPFSQALLYRAVEDEWPVVTDDLQRMVRVIREFEESAPAADSPFSRALIYRNGEDMIVGVTESGLRTVEYQRNPGDFLDEPIEFIGRMASLYRRVGEDVLDPDDWTYARIGNDYRIVPRITILSVTRNKVSHRDGYDTATVNFFFDLPVLAWTIRLNSTSHLDGDPVADWRSFPPTQYGTATIPASLLRRGANTLTVYGQSLGGIWTR